MNIKDIIIFQLDIMFVFSGESGVSFFRLLPKKRLRKLMEKRGNKKHLRKPSPKLGRIGTSNTSDVAFPCRLSWSRKFVQLAVGGSGVSECTWFHSNLQKIIGSFHMYRYCIDNFDTIPQPVVDERPKLSSAYLQFFFDESCATLGGFSQTLGEGMEKDKNGRTLVWIMYNDVMFSHVFQFYENHRGLYSKQLL